MGCVNRRWVILLSGFFLCLIQVSANTLLIRNTDQPLELSPYIRYGKVNFSVHSGKLIIDYSDTSLLKPLNSHPTPYSPEYQKLLFHVNVRNETPEEHWFLSIDFYPLHYITLYLTDSYGNILAVQHGGALQKIHSGFHDRTSHVFPFTLSQNTSCQIFITVETRSYLLFPATLHSASTLVAVKSQRLLYIWLTFGLVFAALILNVTLYLSTRELPFLILIALMLVLSVASYYQYGFGFELLPGMPDFFKIRMRILFVAPIGILLNLFTIRFLGLRNNEVLSNLYRASNILLLIYFVLIIIPFVPFNGLNFVSPMILTLIMILNILAAFYALRNHKMYAGWYIPGIISLILSSATFTAILLQSMPFHPLLYHANYFGTALFCLMLTLGMHLKIAAIRESEHKLAISQKINTELKMVLESKEQITRMLEQKTKELLAEQQTTRLLSSAVESSDSTIVITNPSGIIKYVNPAFTKISGYLPMEAIGKNPSVLRSGTHDDAFYQNLWITILAGNTWKGEFHNRKKNGDLYWEYAVITPVVDKETRKITHFIAVKDDITEKKDFIDRLALSEKLLREANQVKDQFFLILSHDLMNPFNALLGFSQILIENLHQKRMETEVEYATIIHDSASKIMGMLQNLLVWSGGNSGNFPFSPSRVSIPGLLADSVAIIIPAAQKRKVEVKIINPVIQEANIDLDLVSVILRNLMWNALHFSSEGQEISVHATLENHHLMIKVHSGGPLFTPEQLSDLFLLPALRKNKDFHLIGKSGFGLFISKELAEIHKWQIFAESIPNQGNIFGISIPQ
ncbi:MAG TPA: PAS domain S-box protein [Bacteroidales bacterium]|nr:PAS domain S-box protein [Bacteroidales bacterium]HRZ49498.1 PAS domain S-box protein [Bacteroidales bacterium]